jgi:hypothetical protein
MQLHAEFDYAHCLFYHSLRIFSWNWSTLGPLEIPFPPPPQHFFGQKSWTGRSDGAVLTNQLGTPRGRCDEHNSKFSLSMKPKFNWPVGERNHFWRLLLTGFWQGALPVPAVIRLKRIYNFWCSMLVYAPFALYFVTLCGIFMHFPELTY